MSFPCPHCGGEVEFTDRRIDEIKPIIPLDLQGTFKEPPDPKPTLISSMTPTYRPVESSSPSFTQIPTPNSPPSPPPSTYSSLRSFDSQTTISVPPPPPSIQFSTKEQSRIPPPPPTGASVPLQPQFSPKPSIDASKAKLDTGVSINDNKKLIKLYESRFKNLESRSKHFESKFKETDNQLKMLKNCMKIILKSNQKLDSIYKDTFKNLKKSI